VLPNSGRRGTRLRSGCGFYRGKKASLNSHADKESITLYNGMDVHVDPDDYEILSRFKWTPIRGAYTTYAACRVGKKRFFMHRVILGASEGQPVDHRDGNGLNNRKINLRLCSTAQNCWNQRRNKKNTSGFKGVYWIQKRRVWEASISGKLQTYKAGGLRHG
jgi:hypothetical protein